MRVAKRFLYLLVLTAFLSGCAQVNPSSEVKELTIHLSNFKIAPSTVEVNRGDLLIMTLVNIEGEHNLYIDGYDLRTTISFEGATEVIEFRATEAGEFEMWCEVRDHRSKGMVGTLIVN
jgi:plastocyanin